MGSSFSICGLTREQTHSSQGDVSNEVIVAVLLATVPYGGL